MADIFLFYSFLLQRYKFLFVHQSNYFRFKFKLLINTQNLETTCQMVIFSLIIDILLDRTPENVPLQRKNFSSEGEKNRKELTKFGQLRIFFRMI